jgi:hypothetical protein
VGRVEFLYLSGREYMVLFGTTTGSEGFSGRYERVEIRGFNIKPGSFHIEYGRGAVVTTLPFGMVETVRPSRTRP